MNRLYAVEYLDYLEIVGYFGALGGPVGDRPVAGFAQIQTGSRTLERLEREFTDPLTTSPSRLDGIGME